MPYTLEIDGVLASPRNLSGQQTQAGTATLNFDLVQSTSGTFATSANVGDPVALVDTDTGDTVFGGFVSEVELREMTNNPDGTYTIDTKVRCVDYTGLARRRLVNEVWEGDNLNTILTELVANYMDGEGVTTNNIPAVGPTIGKAIFSWRFVADALDELAEQLNYSWWIDADKDLNFVQRTDNAAPFAIDSGNRNFLTMSKRKNTNKYSNSVILRGGKGLTNTLTEDFVGDGTRRTFSLSYPVGEKPSSIIAAGVTIAASDIGIKGLDTSKKWYYNKDSHELTQDDLETVLGTTDALEVQYKGLYRIIIQAEDSASIAERAAASSGTSGRFEMLEVDASIEDLSLADEVAQGFLTRYGASLPETVVFTTDAQNLRAGQLLTINLPELNIADDFLIDTVAFSDRGDHELRYKVQALSGQSLGGWQYYWRNITRTDNIAIGDEFITKLLQATEQLNVSDIGVVGLIVASPWHIYDVTRYGLHRLWLESDAPTTPSSFHVYDVTQYGQSVLWKETSVPPAPASFHTYDVTQYGQSVLWKPSSTIPTSADFHTYDVTQYGQSTLWLDASLYDVDIYDLAEYS